MNSIVDCRCGGFCCFGMGQCENCFYKDIDCDLQNTENDDIIEKEMIVEMIYKVAPNGS